ncbi:mitotic interactor and substrate of PLK1 [Diceros bicornis minor]|uniref:mitotic interactor and substrate of PLK1 n=1 Tax=Diceros bicornis minor TaxID=77932 RepID=UPI0026EB8432|nr:mitotic interactor and substrate of PLK1 [Diceros bicornis minor]
MDRVTRYPILSIPHPPRLTGPAFDGDNSYTYELVTVGPLASGWNRDELQGWPADHKARVNVVRTAVSSNTKAVPGQLSLRSLYVEDDEDEEVKAYRLGATDAPPRRPRDLEQEPWVVIQGQAVKKSGTVATFHGTPDHGGRGSPGRPQPVPWEEDAVDREQIDFLAARRQFLNLEQANAVAPRRPPARVAPTRPPPGVGQAPQVLSRPPLANGYVVAVKPQVKEVILEEKSVRGLPAGFGVQAVDERDSWSQVEAPEAPKETPIEREIRLAQEREAALREQRGLRGAAGHQELVEVLTRPLLTKVSLAEAPRRERGRPSLYVQRDLVQETQREQEHRREGLQVGRAATPDWASEGVPAAGLRRALSSDSILGPAPDARAADPAPEVRKVNRIPPDAYQPYLGSGTPRPEFPAFHAYGRPSGPSADEAKAVGSPKVVGYQRHLLESSGKPSGTQQEHSKPPQGCLQANGGVVRVENFHLRPLRFGVPDAPQKAEVSRVWGWEVSGAPPLRLQKSQSSEMLEKEMESVLRREREVAEERRSALFPEVFSPTSPNQDRDHGSRGSSQASGITGSYSVSEVHVSPTHLNSGLVWTVEAPAGAAPVQRKRKEQWYAGINPADEVNSEILEATRVTRHKSARAERWEAGIYTSEDED